VGSMGRPAVAPLADIVRQASDEGYRRFALMALGELGDVAVETLTPLLTDPREDVRHHAAQALSRKPTGAARAALLDGTHSDDPTVRYYCSLGLAALRDRSLAPRLVELLDDRASCLNAAAGLAGIDATAYRVRLGRMACCDASGSVRETVVRILQGSADPVARRIGRRYEKPYVRPDLELAITLRNITKFGLTAGVLAILGCLTLLPGAAGVRVRAVPACVAAFVVGLVWGRVLPEVWLIVELEFLVLVLPLTATCGWMLVRAADGAGSPRTRSWLAIVGACYAGFAIGWVWLWGLLGF
jgi:hypothetical protein